MSGHSKWSTIKRKKEKTDAQRGKIFTKIGREISVAVKEAGADPTVNARLRDLITKARSNNVPADNIDRIIKKAAGSGGKDDYVSIVYEGYGPAGIAVMVDALTDNKNRTAADVRHYFDKFGGNLGTTGCVSFMFTQKGIIIVDPSEYNEDEIMETVLEAGAEDFEVTDDAYEITVDPGSFSGVTQVLEDKGIEMLSAEIEYIPDMYTTLTDDEQIKKMNLLLDSLEDNDDVQNVWHNWENCD